MLTYHRIITGYGAHRCSNGNPPGVAHNIQRMFEKAAADFLLAPDDTSFLFVVPCMHSAPWFHFTRSYHVVHIHRKADSACMFSRLRAGTYRPLHFWLSPL